MKPNDLLNRLAAGFDYDPMYGELCNERDALQAENDKLRELVRKLYNMADFCRNCPDTERCDVDVEWFGCTVADPIDKLMEELRVDG